VTVQPTDQAGSEAGRSLVLEAKYGRVTGMCWVGLRYLVCGTDTGGVVVCGTDGGGLRVCREVRCSTGGVACVESVGGGGGGGGGGGAGLVAVGYRDGCVRVFAVCENEKEENNIDENEGLRLHSVIQCPEAGLSVACLGVKPVADDGLVVVLVGYGGCGGELGRRKLVGYWYDETRFRWERQAGLGGLEGLEGLDGALEIADIAWSPLMGRETERVAVAVGTDVVVYGLGGSVDGISVSEPERLRHADEVCQVRWNATGTWLAASTRGNEVCLWRPDLSGQWRMLNVITGS